MATTIKEPLFDLTLGNLFAQLSRIYTGLLSASLQSSGADRYINILIFLGSCPTPVKQQYLVYNLGIDKASMVRMLDYLHEKKLLIRTVNPANRREYLLSLSTKGKRSIPIIKDAIKQTEDMLLEGLSPIAKNQLLDSLKYLIRNSEIYQCRTSLTSFKR